MKKLASLLKINRLVPTYGFYYMSGYQLSASSFAIKLNLIR